MALFTSFFPQQEGDINNNPGTPRTGGGPFALAASATGGSVLAVFTGVTAGVAVGDIASFTTASIGYSGMITAVVPGTGFTVGLPQTVNLASDASVAVSFSSASTTVIEGDSEIAGDLHIAGDIGVMGDTTTVGSSLVINETLTVTGDTNLDGALTVDGNVILGDAAEDSIVFNSTNISFPNLVAGNIVGDGYLGIDINGELVIDSLPDVTFSSVHTYAHPGFNQNRATALTAFYAVATNRYATGDIAIITHNTGADVSTQVIETLLFTATSQTAPAATAEGNWVDITNAADGVISLAPIAGGQLSVVGAGTGAFQGAVTVGLNLGLTASTVPLTNADGDQLIDSVITQASGAVAIAGNTAVTGSVTATSLDINGVSDLGGVVTLSALTAPATGETSSLAINSDGAIVTAGAGGVGFDIPGGGTGTTAITDADITATAGDLVILPVSTRTNPTVLVPLAPSRGTSVKIANLSSAGSGVWRIGSTGANPGTIQIMGTAQTDHFTLDDATASFEMIYTGLFYGWVIIGAN